MFRPIAPIWGRTVIWEGASRLFLGENYQNTRRLSSQEKTEASDLASATGLTRGMPRSSGSACALEPATCYDPQRKVKRKKTPLIPQDPHPLYVKVLEL